MRAAIFADHCGRDPLPDLRLGIGVFQDAPIGVAMGIDKSGAHREAHGINNLVTRADSDLTDLDDPVPHNADVGMITRPSSAIVNRPTPNHDLPRRERHGLKKRGYKGNEHGVSLHH